MGSTTLRLDIPGWTLAPALIGFGLLVGLLAGYDPKLAIAASLAAGFVLVALTDLGVGVAVFAVLTYIYMAPNGGSPLLSFSKAAGLILALCWLARVTASPRISSVFFTRNGVLAAVLALFLAWVLASMIWAEDPSRTITALARYAPNVVLILVVFTAVASLRDAARVLAGVAVGATSAALYGLIRAPDASAAVGSLTPASDLNRITGTVGDPNVLASVLVLGIVVCLAFALDPERGGLSRGLATGAALICVMGVLETLSRGGLIALGAALVAAIVFGARHRAAFAAAALAVGVSAILYFAAFAPAGAFERVTQADGGTGRTDVWQVGWRMVSANPVAGVGAGNFPVSSVHYLLIEPGAIDRSDFIVDTPLVAHNIYLGILAELGVVGLSLFLALVVLCLRAAATAARTFARLGESSLELFARAVVIGLVALLAADFFISAEFTKQLWLMLAMGPALLAIARHRASGKGNAPIEADGFRTSARPSMRVAPQATSPRPADV